MDSVEALLSQNGAPSGFIFLKGNTKTILVAGAASVDVFFGQDDEGLWITCSEDTNFECVEKDGGASVYTVSLKANSWFPVGLRSKHKLVASSASSSIVNILVAEDA